MLTLRARTEAGWALISWPGFSKFLFSRYVEISIWWRWRGSNPRPQALHLRYYMLSLSLYLTMPPPDRTGKAHGEPQRFNQSTRGGASWRSCVKLPLGVPHYTELRAHKRDSVRGWPSSSQSVVVVVGNYYCTACFTRLTVTSACTLGSITHVEAISPPRFIFA